MLSRDAWLFAALGWDPTWQRRVPGRVKLVWNTALAFVAGALATLAVIAVLALPSGLRYLPIGIMVLGSLTLAAVQVLLRRELLGRLDTDADQHAAREIQRRLLPVALPTMAGLDLAHHYAPFRVVGGDYYDVVPLDDSSLLIAMADVSGKGTGAALLTASVQAILHFAVFGAEAHDGPCLPPLERLAAGLNAHLALHTQTNRFVTMVIAVLDLRSRRLRYVNAGHNPPLALLPDGGVRRLDATGLPLGMLEAATYACSELDLPAGTTLLFYTDGLSEHPNPGFDLYGEARICQSLRANASRPARDAMAALLEDVTRFAGDEPAGDDTAILLVRLLREHRDS